jgi:excisionase family DNA binding protein
MNVAAAAAAGITERLLTPDEVAALFRVERRTAVGWGAAGLLGAVRTPGGQLRFRASAVALHIGCPLPPAPSAGKAQP